MMPLAPLQQQPQQQQVSQWKSPPPGGVVLPVNQRHWYDICQWPSFCVSLPGASNALESIAETNPCQLSMLLQSQPLLGIFVSAAPPRISFRDFAIRQAKYFQCSPQVWVSALVLIDRLCQKFRRYGGVICDRTIHRLWWAACVVSAKLRDDVYYAIEYYGKIMGFNRHESGIMERFFLVLIDWRVHVNKEEYVQWWHHCVPAELQRATNCSYCGARLTPCPAAAHDWQGICLSSFKQRHIGPGDRVGSVDTRSITAPTATGGPAALSDITNFIHAGDNRAVPAVPGPAGPAPNFFCGFGGIRQPEHKAAYVFPAPSRNTISAAAHHGPPPATAQPPTRLPVVYHHQWAVVQG